MRHGHRKRRQQDVNLAAFVIHSVKTSVRDRIAARDMVAVVGKLFARRESRCFADNLVAFDDELAAIGVNDHPFAPEQSDGAIGAVFDRDEINERVWLVGRQRRPAVVIGKFIESGYKTGKRAGTAGHDARRLGM